MLSKVALTDRNDIAATAAVRHTGTAKNRSHLVASHIFNRKVVLATVSTVAVLPRIGEALAYVLAERRTVVLRQGACEEQSENEELHCCLEVQKDRDMAQSEIV